MVCCEHDAECELRGLPCDEVIADWAKCIEAGVLQLHTPTSFPLLETKRRVIPPEIQAIIVKRLTPYPAAGVWMNTSSQDWRWLRCRAWWPRKTFDEGWIWLRLYWLWECHSGWGFIDKHAYINRDFKS